MVVMAVVAISKIDLFKNIERKIFLKNQWFANFRNPGRYPPPLERDEVPVSINRLSLGMTE